MTWLTLPALPFITLPASAQNAPAQPVFTTYFLAESVALHGTGYLYFEITNPAGASQPQLTGVAFTDQLPKGLIIATPNNLAVNCDGQVTAAAGSGSISVSRMSIEAGKRCTVSLNVTAVAAGEQVNETGPITTDQTGSGAKAKFTLNVVAPPKLKAVFGTAAILLNANTTLVFTLSNPNAKVGLQNVRFSDALSDGLKIAPDANSSGSCLKSENVVVEATPGGSSISLAGLDLAPSATCDVSVMVVGTQLGPHSNTVSDLNASFEDGMGTSIGISGAPATAKIAVLKPRR